VLVTGKGQPDLATRAFCNKLLACFPSIKVRVLD
jgi:DNA topoisomerase VI subunit A